MRNLNVWIIWVQPSDSCFHWIEKPILSRFDWKSGDKNQSHQTITTDSPSFWASSITWSKLLSLQIGPSSTETGESSSSCKQLSCFRASTARILSATKQCFSGKQINLNFIGWEKELEIWRGSKREIFGFKDLRDGGKFTISDILFHWNLLNRLSTRLVMSM